MTSATEKKLLILGAGPTGLGAGWRLAQRGHANWAIRERNAYPGGLSASFLDAQGFTWDIGGHVVFSHYPEFDRFFDEMTGGDVFRHERRSYIRLAGAWIPYPFQNNIHRLPPNLRQECLDGLEQVAGCEPDTSNFLAWNLSRLGSGITRLFIEPDNRKRWACPLDRMSADWVADRVSPVNLDRIRENIRLNRDDVSWGPNNTFQFPRHGGTGRIFQEAARRLGDRVAFGHEAVAIDSERRMVRYGNGHAESYDALLSTLPISQLMRIVLGAPRDLVQRALQLRRANSLILGFGLRGPCPSEKCWIYCPEEPAPFYRVTYLSNYSPFNAPGEQFYSLMCDISYSDLFPHDLTRIVENTLRGLEAVAILMPGERKAIVSTHLIDAPYSYPVPTLDRDAILEELHAWLEPRGIHARGRMGAWLYEIGNMDHCVMQGLQWADAQWADTRENVWLDRR